ncbi:Tripartite-type tricarboxylate transporter, receptor component TctC [Salinihabitans flavidus]|uniref:Tripartite-type tricarboxylate transporter, receptor component TctC n=1 Tax=Salinihabitans flavidus TaxID=569882 RepID=A0A1H8UA42_9RHOB|nr:tripartite tricarboxylate transporter substrate binding protein [Salinihabitans flavidus]SEP00099.1 Tripartite-type tricarboxylate transporter, receptor component TctC [Salinihabitans flavidus]
MKSHIFKLSAAVAGICLGTVAMAEFPERAVTIVVPFSAGGGTDITARVLAGPMADALGTEVVVKNTDGAGGTIGAAATAAARDDGYTVGLLPVGPMTTQPHLRNLPYGPDSFDYVCLAYSAPSAIVVRKDSEFNSLADMIEFGKENPDVLNFGVQAIGSIPHVAGLGLADAAGIDFTYVPYAGSGPTFTAMLDGSVHMFVAHVSFLTTNADQVKSIALLSDERISTASDLKTAGEQGVDMNFPIWGGLVVPKGVDPEVRDKLETACEAGVNSDAFVERMESLGTPVVYMGGDEFESFVRAEFERNDGLLSAAGLKAE